MLQFLGILFIMGGILGLGNHYLEKEKQRILRLETWEYITELYISEIKYKKQPLFLASIEIGKKIEGDYGKILKNIGENMSAGKEDFFSKTWKKEWESLINKEPLKKEEKRMILDFPLFIGFENEELQRNMLKVQQDKWKKIRERAEEENREKKKIVFLLSFSTGILIVLILL